MIKVSGIFSIFYSVLLLSRIYVIAGVYTLPVDPSLIQMGYVGVLIMVAIVQIKENNYKITKHIKTMDAAILLLVGYWVLFGFVFVNPPMEQYTKAMVLRQGLFLATIIATALFACRNNYFAEVISVSFWTIAVVLLFQFITNINDVTQIDIRSILNVSSRSRVNFGLGHYNYLGMLCSCEIILGIWIRKFRGKNKLSLFVIALSSVMLLGSASRNAIFGLIVFGLIEFYFSLEQYAFRKVYKFIIQVSIFIIVLMMALFGDNSVSLNGLLLDSNRLTLFSVALPTFFKSNRTWIGLGLASGEIYGQNLTPYKTYWLDNGYIYTLITSGYIGIAIYVILIILFLFNYWKLKNRNNAMGVLAIATFSMYLFSALFETTLFNGGVLLNYLLLPIFLMLLDNRFMIENRKLADLNEVTK
ncbi:MAG: hypothetical protein ACLSG4_09640 [Anaerobutyricum sp.]